MNDEDYESQTALHLAAGGGHHDIVLELLSAGADTDARSLRYTIQGDVYGDKYYYLL